jgi:hypothetical protein
MEMIPCLKCKEPMPKIRLEKFGYKVCCNCSTVKAQKAITIQGGSGDHTWNDIQIVSSAEYENYMKYNSEEDE